MSDQEWITAAKAKFSYPNPILPVYYTAEAYERKRGAYPKDQEWRDGDLDREKTKARMVQMGLDVTGL